MTAEVMLVGHPDGPVEFVNELGMEVPTFTQAPKKKCLMWHVPLNVRGQFRPDQLANFDVDTEYRTDALGWLLCYAKSKTTEKRCKNRAVNRYPRCALHGGQVHPLDKIAEPPKTAMSSDEFESMTRYQQFQAGAITVDDLTDEELTAQGFKARNGSIYKPKNLPRELLTAFTRAIYERATQELRNGTISAAKLLVDMVEDDTVEDNLRLKAAQEILDRNLGKAAQSITVTHQAPWEAIFDRITVSNRSESRRARGVLDVEAEEITDNAALEPTVAEIDPAPLYREGPPLVEPLDIDKMNLDPHARREELLNPVLELEDSRITEADF